MSRFGRCIVTVWALMVMAACGVRAQTNLITPVTVLPKADESAGGKIEIRNPLDTASAVIIQDAAPQIDASALAGPLTIKGANATNGNILLQPGNVASNASVFIESPRLDWPGLIIRDPAGTTTGNSLELRQNNNTVYLKVIGGTDAGAGAAGALLTRNHFGLTGDTYDLGATSNRWLTVYSNNLSLSANVLSNLIPNITNTHNLGSSSNRWSTVFGQNFNGFTIGETNHFVSTQKLDLYDYVSGANALWDIRAAWNPAASSLLEIRDNAGTPVVQFYRAFVGSPADFADVHVDWQPDANLSQSLGVSGRRWSKLWVQDIDLTGTCTGCPGGVSSVTGTTPISASPTTGAVVVSCPTCVTTDTTQTISGAKTFTSELVDTVGIHASAATGYMKAGKFEFRDNGGGALVWDAQATVVSGLSSFWVIRDNAGTVVLKLNRVTGSSTIDDAEWQLHQVPLTNSTWDLGESSRKWRDGWLISTHTSDLCAGSASTCSSATNSNQIAVYGNYLPGFNNTYDIGTSGTRVRTTYTIDLNASGSIATPVNVTASGTIQGSTLNATSAYNVNSTNIVNSSRALLNITGLTMTGDIATPGNITASTALFVVTSGITRFSASGGGIITRNSGGSIMHNAATTTGDFDIQGIYRSAGFTGTTSNLSCGAGEAIKNLNVVGGIVISFSCGAP